MTGVEQPRASRSVSFHAEDVGKPEEASSTSATSSDSPRARKVQQHKSGENRRMSYKDKVDKIGGKYTKREFLFVFASGVVLSFNSGYVNGSCLSGFLTDNGARQGVTAFTGGYSNSALALARGDEDVFFRQAFMIMSFVFGSCISGMLTPNAEPHILEPTYGPTFLLGAVFLATASILRAFFNDDYYFFYLAAAANGIQNGMSSLYSANLIRSTHLTGTSTDIGLFVGQLIRGNRKNLWKLLVLCSLASSFWFGGFVSFYMTRQFTGWSLLFNAGLYFMIGIALTVFLVQELNVTIAAVLTGTWMWEKVFDQLEATILSRAVGTVSESSESQGNDGDARFGGLTGSGSKTRSQYFGDYFDSLQQGAEEEELDASALFEALVEEGIDISRKQVRVLMQRADQDGNRKLSRDEWINIVRQSQRKSSKRLNYEKDSVNNV